MGVGAMAKTKAKASESPIWLHKASGQWCKKVKQRVVYLGKDYDAALVQWATHKDRLLAGLGLPSTEERSPALGELCNLFLANLRERKASDGLSEVYLGVVTARLRKVVAAAGRDTRLQHYTPAQWDELRAKLSKNENGEDAAPNTMAHRVEVLRIVVKWANDRKLTAIEVPKSFCKPSKKAIRRFRNNKKSQLWISREDIRRLIDAADIVSKPVILLGVNCGLGSADIAKLTQDDIDLTQKEVWLSVSRQKTETMRHLWLWPETIEALRAYDAIRPIALRRRDENLLLLTAQKWAWQDETSDRVPPMFRRTCQKAGVTEQVTHYGLRRSLLTAIITLGFPESLARSIAGHEASNDILFEHYIGPREREQIRDCLQSVREWLFA